MSNLRRPRTVELPGYPIAEMPRDGGYYLVSIQGATKRDGSPWEHFAVGRWVGEQVLLDSGAVFQATHFHPLQLTYPRRRAHRKSKP